MNNGEFINNMNSISNSSNIVIKNVRKHLGKMAKCFKIRLYQGLGQYEDVWWVKLTPNKKYINWEDSLKDDFKAVTAIHIMPYCITEDDIINANIKYKDAGKIKKSGKIPFNEVNDNNFVDFDPTTGNFHKKIDLKNQQIQIVLIEKGGPKWYEKTNDKNTIVKDNKYVVKNDWYFPKIDSKNNNLIELSFLLERALSTILKSVTWHSMK